MFRFWQGLTILLVSVGMALALAHVLEFPDKRRLGREAYFAVQTIYYPGFTVGGAFGEFGAILATLVLLAVTPVASRGFWPTLVAALAMLSMHATIGSGRIPSTKSGYRARNSRERASISSRRSAISLSAIGPSSATAGSGRMSCAPASRWSPWSRSSWPDSRRKTALTILN